MMSGIRGKDTRPEMLVRRGLHGMGFRYRLHVRSLPGNPDLVFPSRGAVLVVHGCFWHGHDCHLFKWPKSRPEFWRQKIGANMERDARALEELRGLGYRTGIVWECALKGKTRLDPEAVLARCAEWLNGDEPRMVVQGDEQGLPL